MIGFSPAFFGDSHCGNVSWNRPICASAAASFLLCRPGRRLTQDRDREGGNPFASALVEVLKAGPATLGDFTGALAASNARHSGGWQQLQFPKKLPHWRMGAAGEEKRVALVLINADYSKSSGVYSLPGAAFDAQRVPEALRKAGFEGDTVLDANAEAARKAIAAFAAPRRERTPRLSMSAGTASSRRVVYWMMGDYPEAGFEMAADSRYRWTKDRQAGRARDVNLVTSDAETIPFNSE
jgi:hypothetical protein